jgi:ABC-type Mn2+/Zn2+ transport system ATPase subunit
VSVREWARSFQQEFEVVWCRIDNRNISATYEAALRLPLQHEENKRAYETLARLAKPNDPTIVYVTALLFRSTTDLQFAADDFQFKLKRSFYDALSSDQRYGAYRGKRNLIVGRSGTGKTSLLKGLEGRLGKLLSSDSNLIAQSSYFFLPQQIELFYKLSPLLNVAAFGGTRDEAERLLARFGLPDNVIHGVDCDALSGGELQRVALAQCIASGADTIVLDEPFRGVDKARRAVLFDLLQQGLGGSSAQRPTLIYVDHDFDMIYRRFDVVFEILFKHQVVVWNREVDPVPLGQ